MDEDAIEINDGDTMWRFDRQFMESNWTCIWGRGCVGILPQPAEHLGQGCCSVGAELDGPEEANLIAALSATLDPEGFQYHREAQDSGIFSDEGRNATRVVDGACIFLNRPGFAGGPGCALHLAALADGESPVGQKPSVCWQLPIRIDWNENPAGTETATVRAWSRSDWGEEGKTMAWCCTEGQRAYVGEQRVVDSMAEEITEMVGSRVYVELRRRLQK